MELLTPSARSLVAYGSGGVELVRAAVVPGSQDGFAVDVVRLAPGGVIGRHPTRWWLLFLVVEGAGWVSGPPGERRPLRAGEAALWAPGEEHASGSADGLVAVVVQCRTRPVPTSEETP
ncbi:cupin domain-containing protein [Geodermatophilus sp. DSM 44513]|uniref:cupin domain-containing protein n=1 Tax=Geodermatophilus sp. DSM 44513 TaxID=1528104 RepID=UPI00127F215C|nr:cupin domain-containing protein [Geodermatophilus sp. DSM 44513]WNV75733.1 cupin domain-containing protein [Geodermatophilus sp. DSM 44513]